MRPAGRQSEELNDGDSTVYRDRQVQQPMPDVRIRAGGLIHVYRCCVVLYRAVTAVPCACLRDSARAVTGPAGGEWAKYLTRYGSDSTH